ncbi:hypothetical protein VitviT2T_025191 [Vitis vinifera]|uniref:Leucine-rich repeat-containing N-terminal plant-type domain-containing protein n=1 Tax=Vitis vinifera TaxID=29760 RepID=A0ABY9DL66_VITVI|nr:receptor-like protein EIX2 [Vitis vinifera]WKA07350.1 hypothetical protein VitviT2T_025191 [Vitis vinifera]|eukprot:XP_002274689.1 PREDICTED: receptor-like protein 12 [Vitis vinifera]
MELYMRGLVVLSLYFLFTLATKFGCCDGHGSKALCREEEREALLSFKRGIHDPSNRLSSWANEECCNWEGVCCHNTTGHVLKLNLRWDLYQDHGSLGGEISSSLLDLKHLQYLDLSCNDFGSLHIPKFLGSLSNLRYLNLSSAGFGGVIPHQLGNLSKLHYLDIGNSDSLNVEDLEWISGLTFLKFLDMANVNLSKASNWLQVMNKFHSLSVLRLSYCELDTFDPLPHVNFSSLVILDLSSNYFMSSSFDWFANLNSLVTLNLAYSNIHGPIPSGLRNMTSLKFLDLSYNNFASPIPDWLYHITSLEYLDLTHNYFHGMLPNDIGNLTSITYLYLSNNALEGDVLRSLGNLCSFQLSNSSYDRPRKGLEFLSLRGNKLSGSFPDTLGECKSLEHLNLAKNRLSGHLPNELGQFKSLSSLSIDGNSFSGHIPISLGGISSLRYLKIRENFFEGIISEKHLANLTSLKQLDASSNLLTLQVSSNWTPPFQLTDLDLGSCLLGPQFPAWLQTQKYLDYLNMSYAGISSVIPAWFWTRPYYFVDLSHNQIIGSIPSLHSSCIYLSSNNFTGPLPPISSDVEELDLSNNLFRGSLSPMLCRRTKKVNLLWYLDISGNLLSGELPNCWMYWRELMMLKLGNNNLTGHIPSSMGSLIWLGSLHLRNNHLSGNFPLPLKNCSSLLVLDLSKNEFTGTIPAWMGNFIEIFPGVGEIGYTPGLMVLVLHSNKFTGSIPLELCHLHSLQILDLGNNNLSGTIPRCFGNFSSMIKELNSSSPFRFHNEHFESGSTDTATLVMKGIEYEYDKTLGLLAGMDLSSNKLSGEIPEELTDLHGLIFLNLSNNHLQGKIPVKIGAMTSLESLDLSMNGLSGVIPQGMANISFLSSLNLSYNNLSGKIPSGTQIQGFSALSFIGNPELCGAPLTDDCGEDGKPKGPIPDNGWIDMKWFYLGMPWGFVVGFWAILAPLAFNRAWRHAYFRLLDDVKYKLLGWCL